MPRNDDLSPLLVSVEGACAALGGISRAQLYRLMDSGQLPVVRLPGGRDRSGRGTTAGMKRIFFAVEDLQKLIRESREHTEPGSTKPAVFPLKKMGVG